MRSRTLVLAGAAALAMIVGGCQKEAAKADPAAVKNAIKTDEKKWNDQFKAQDQEGIVSHYANDAYFAGAGVKPVDGSTAIREAYAKALADPIFTVSFASDKIDVASSGDMAYSRGHFTEKYTDPKTNKAMTDSGSYLTVYKKQSDGSWKAVEDFAPVDPDSAKPVAPGKAVTHATAVSM